MAVVQVGCVTDPADGAAGVAGCVLIVPEVVAAELQPDVAFLACTV